MLEQLQELIRRMINAKAFPCLGKVSKVYAEAGKYFAEVRELRNGGEETDTLYMDVLIPKLWGTENGGIWMTPSAGAVVLLNFLNGDRNYPIIAAVMGSAAEEEHPEGELLIKVGGTELRIADKVVLKNASSSLGGLLGEISELSAELKTLGPPGPHSLSPDLIAKWKLFAQKSEGLFKE